MKSENSKRGQAFLREQTIAGFGPCGGCLLRAEAARCETCKALTALLDEAEERGRRAALRELREVISPRQVFPLVHCPHCGKIHDRDMNACRGPDGTWPALPER